MACLSDVPRAVRAVGLWGLVMRVKREVDQDNLWALGAAMAYSWLFALFPFLIFLMGLLPYLPESAKERAKAEIHAVVYTSFPQEAADTIWSNVDQILGRTRGGLLSLGLLITIWGASGGMNTTITAIDRCYEVEESRPFYKQRPIAILLTIVTAVMVILVLLLLPVGTSVIRWLQRQSDNEYVSVSLLWTWRALRYPIAILLMFAILNLLYHFGPDLKQKYAFFTPGAVFCVVVWLLLGLAFRAYIDRFGRFNETYGAIGGVIILLFLLYLDAVVLLVGAEINSEIDYAVTGLPRGARDFTVRG